MLAQVFGKAFGPCLGNPSSGKLAAARKTEYFDNCLPSSACPVSNSVSPVPTIEGAASVSAFEPSGPIHAKVHFAAAKAALKLVSTFEPSGPIYAPVHFAAAKAALKEHPFWSRFWMVVVAYRVLGLVANCAFLGILLWWIQPAIVVVMFVLLWYIPAVWRSGLQHAIREKGRIWRTELWVGPFVYPVLMFVADDFSWLRIHPGQRKAYRQHLLYVFRVVMMLWLVLESHHASNTIINENPDQYGNSPLEQIHDAFDKVLRGSSVKYLMESDWANFVTVFWVLVAEAIVCTSVLWVGITSILIVATWRGWVETGKDEALLARVDYIAKAIEQATRHEDPCQCRLQLLRLTTLDKGAGGCPDLQCVHAFWPPSSSAYFVAGQYAVHSILRLLNVYTFFSSHTFAGYVGGGVLLAHVAVTAFKTYSWGLGDPRAVLHEVQMSTRRGIFTPRLFELKKSDKGVLTLPALIFVLASLPWTIYLNGHSAEVQAGMAIVQIALITAQVATTGVFVFEEFDLGVEREGKDSGGRWDPKMQREPTALSPNPPGALPVSI